MVLNHDSKLDSFGDFRKKGKAWVMPLGKLNQNLRAWVVSMLFCSKLPHEVLMHSQDWEPLFYPLAACPSDKVGKVDWQRLLFRRNEEVWGRIHIDGWQSLISNCNELTRSRELEEQASTSQPEKNLVNRAHPCPGRGVNAPLPKESPVLALVPAAPWLAFRSEVWFQTV